ncbi:maintenance of telomere capping protein 1 [Lipomyces doorenjongii]
MTSTNSKDDKDVLEFLESLGPARSRSPSVPAESAGAEPSEKELLGFLDELTQETSVKDDGREHAASDSKMVATDGDAIDTRDPPGQAVAHVPTPPPVETKAAYTKSRDPVSSITSWLGSSGIWDSASAVVKGAEARVRDIQQNADTTSWETKVKGIGFSKTLASTLSSVLHTIAPPILRHEQLRIHIFHDIVGYPSIDTIVYSVFDRVMQQVEGGELIIVQKGRESRRRDSDKKGVQRDMGLFQGGLAAGEKLARANVEQIKIKGKEPEMESEESPVRKSDIYLSIQACAFSADTKSSDAKGDSESDERLFNFIIYLNDPVHDLSYVTHSQSFPLQWCEWLDSDEPIAGQIDPREWLAEWVEEGLGLAVGVVAQRYVASRMAIGMDLHRSG